MNMIEFETFGEPDVLRYVTTPMPEPGLDEVLIHVEAIGVNYADIGRRRNRYVQSTPLPYTPGSEVVGIVVAHGANVSTSVLNQRVLWLGKHGGYAEYVCAPAGALVTVPDDLDPVTAVAVPNQGITAYHILKTSGRLAPGERVLIHAAAGGVGGLAIQLARHFGAAQVIGTASTSAKLVLIQELGADVALNYSATGWSSALHGATDGYGVDVVLESVGGAVFDESLDCLAPFGRMVVYGAASGQAATRSLMALGTQLLNRNQALVGFHRDGIVAQPALLHDTLHELFALVRAGTLSVTIGQVLPLRQAATAHRLIESRRSVGKVVLTP